MVSVIVPAFNAAACLPRAIDSALSQTYENLEILVVDDGSTDDTRSVVSRMVPPVRAFHQPNAGASAARNVAIRHASGDLVAFLDADDEWLPEKVGIQVTLLEQRPEIDMVYTRAYLLDRDRRVIGVGPPHRGEDTYGHLFHGNRMYTSSVMVRRQAVERAGGFDPALRVAHDYDLWLRIAAGGAYCGIDEPLIRFWNHGTGLGSHRLDRHRDHLKLLDHAPLRPQSGVTARTRERCRAHYQYRLGRDLVRSGSWRDARVEFGRILPRPWRYGFRRQGPADHSIHYLKAVGWYLASAIRSAGAPLSAEHRSATAAGRPRCW